MGPIARRLEDARHPVVVDRRGHIVFKEEAPLSRSRLGDTLAGYTQPGGRVSWQPLQIGVVSGDLAPEFSFRAGGGAELSLRRMRGRRVVLTFWASWCEPSLEQLREFRRAYESACGRGPLVLAIGDGESADSVARVAREERLPFIMVSDPAGAVLAAIRCRRLAINGLDWSEHACGRCKSGADANRRRRLGFALRPRRLWDPTGLSSP